jgi:hypothetical protein
MLKKRKKKHVGVHKARIHDHHAAHHSTKDEGIEENEDRKNSHESKLNRQAHHSKHRRELKKAHPHHGHHKRHHPHNKPVSCSSSKKQIQAHKAAQHFKLGKVRAKYQKLVRTYKRTKKAGPKNKVAKKIIAMRKVLNKQKSAVKKVKAIQEHKINPKSHAKNAHLAKKLHDVVKYETHKMKKLVKVLKRKDISHEVKTLVRKSLARKIRALHKVKTIEKKMKHKEDPKVHNAHVKKMILSASNDTSMDMRRIQFLTKFYHGAHGQVKSILKRVIKAVIKSARKTIDVIKKLKVNNFVLRIFLQE